MSQQKPIFRRTSGLHPALSISLSIVGVALAGMACWILAFWLLQQFQARRCPDDTFLYGSNAIANLFQGVPLLIPALGVGFLVYNRLAPLPIRAPRYRAYQSMVSRWTLISLLLALPVSVAASLSQYCLRSDAILYQAYPWSGLRDYEWGDVVGVTTACYYSGGRSPGWRKQFVLTMRDGPALDLMAREAAGICAYRAIVQALHGQDFSFDSSGVARQCPQPFLGMLTSRP
jgi:hypothetical protein